MRDTHLSRARDEIDGLDDNLPSRADLTYDAALPGPWPRRIDWLSDLDFLPWLRPAVTVEEPAAC